MVLEFLQDRLNEIVAYKFLHNFAVGLISVFIPVYFAKSGLPVHLVFGILLAQVVAFALVALPTGIAISRIGVNKSFLLSSLIYVILFVAVEIFRVSPTLAIIAGSLNGLGMAFHWIPLNSEFTFGSDRKSRSKDLGKLQGIPSLVSPLAPLLGGFILTYTGFYFLVLAALSIITLSAIPLKAGEHTERPAIDITSSIRERDKILWLLYAVDGFASVPFTFIFPLFVYFVIGGTLNVGIASTLAGIGSGLLALGFGYLANFAGRIKVMISGIMLSVFLCLYIPLVESSIVAFYVSFLLGAGYQGYSIPLGAMISNIAEERELLGFFSVREVFQNLGRLAIISVLVASLYLLPQALAFKITFYLNAVSLLLLGILANWIFRNRDF